MSAGAPTAPCNTGYPPPGYPASGYPVPGYPPAGYPPTGFSAGGIVPGSAYVTDGEMSTEGVSSGEVIMQEFPTSPIEGSTQVLQRPTVSSPILQSVDDGDVITVPGPELGPMPNG